MITEEKLNILFNSYEVTFKLLDIRLDNIEDMLKDNLTLHKLAKDKILELEENIKALQR